MERMIELDVGERRIINDMAVECAATDKQNGCSICALRDTNCAMMACISWDRKDGNNVYFKRVE